ncbi:TerD family protein [Amycolatopsis thermophila]|uniref:TerD domain-containing protein n=1 Tax=Amycolatopsis thermophila TaxID=206084 RepID=A0ABU0EMQ7_9PSEU|nr:hypothetical protein [Amycolatopsis thermophila]MDQ0376559.1 hypothetical protein [Amycolatopsis thermophila]
MSLTTLLVQRTKRVPIPTGPSGDGATVARQLDAALMDVGFKLSGELLRQLSAMSPGVVIDLGVSVLGAVRELAGDHVQHNVYFKRFPQGVPDTITFWLQCLGQLAPADGQVTLSSFGTINLVDLPTYGRYQHTYYEMLAAHEELIAAAGDRVTVLHLGGTLQDEAHRLYLQLASSTVPLPEHDRALFETLAVFCADNTQPDTIPARENRAVINRVRFAHHRPLLVDTVTDVLRLAAALSGGDVTLETATRFRGLSRKDRRALLAALDTVAANPAKLGDVKAHARAWVRLAGGLHAEDYADRYPNAARVFTVARGDDYVPSIAARVDAALGVGDVPGAVRVLQAAPGLLMRSLDRVARAAGPDAHSAILDAVHAVRGKVSARVLLSVREHLINRVAERDGTPRVFTNRKGKAWVTEDNRLPLPHGLVHELCAAIDSEITARLADRVEGTVLFDPDFLRIALPLSGKTAPRGMGVVPRGSMQRISGDVLSFFIHWRQNERRTDYDLSVQLYADGFREAGHVSYTALRHGEIVHSGDITDARDGATEIIDVPHGSVDARYVMPQVLLFAGESFIKAAEAFFGYMTRDRAQKGQPYEPRTVRAKSDLTGRGRVAFPVLFLRDDDGAWWAKWLHLYTSGRAQLNQVEHTRATAGTLARGIIDREYLNVGYLIGMAGQHSKVEPWHGQHVDGPVTFIGWERPEGLPESTRVITVDNLADLIPE